MMILSPVILIPAVLNGLLTGAVYALVALGLTNSGRSREADGLLRRVAAKQEGGRLEAAQTSITGSGGRDLAIETTALAVLAWMKTNPTAFDAQVRGSVNVQRGTRDPRRRIGEPQSGQSLQQVAQGDRGLQSRQRRAHAEVRAVAEREDGGVRHHGAEGPG